MLMGLFGFFFGDNKAGASVQQAPPANRGNNVGVNHGTVVQHGGGTVRSSRVGPSQRVIFDEPQDFAVNERSFYGRCLEQRAGRILLDGKDVTDEIPTPAYKLEIRVMGNVGHLQTNAEAVTITGTVGSVQTKSGAVAITGNVTGSVDTNSGDVRCGSVGGNVKTNSGDIHRS